LISISPLGTVLTKRFDDIGLSLQMPVSSDLDSAQDHSDKIRLLLWRESLSLARNAPLLGHGPGAAPALIAQSSAGHKRHYNHFHNIWMHWLVTIGIVGALGFALLFYSLAIRSTSDAMASDRLVSWSAVGLWIYFFVITLAQLRVNHPSGQAFVILLGGMSYFAAFDKIQNSSEK